MTRPKRRLARTLSYPLSLLTAGALSACSGTSPAPPQGAPAPSQKASVAPAVPGIKVIWKYRVGQEGIPQVDHLVAGPSGDLLVSAGSDNAGFLFRFDAEGQFQWKQELTMFRSWFGGVAIDAGGNTYAAAWYDQEVKMGGRSLTKGTDASVFFLKLDREGKRVWSKVLDGTGVESPVLFLRPSGQVVMGGTFRYDLRLGQETLHGGQLRYGARLGNLFLAQFDETGRSEWARELVTDAFFTNVLVDASGNLLVSGDFWGSLLFHPSARPMEAQPGPDESRAHFVAKLDSAGRPVWTRRLEAQTMRLARDGSGDVYTCPLNAHTTEGVRKIAADGRVLFKLPLPKEGPTCTSFDVDEQGMIYVAGVADGAVPPGGTDPENVEVVVKMDSTGKILSTVPLFPHITVTLSVQVLWWKGRVFVAGVKGTYKDPSFYLAEVTF